MTGGRPAERRVALVTGAASGIGRALAARFSAAGANVPAATSVESSVRAPTVWRREHVSRPMRLWSAMAFCM